MSINKAILNHSLKYGMQLIEEEHESAKNRQVHIENFTKHNKEVSKQTKIQSFISLFTAIAQGAAGVSGIALGLPTDTFLKSLKINPELTKNIQHFCQTIAPKITEAFSQMFSTDRESVKTLKSGRKDISNIEINEESSNKQRIAQDSRNLANTINQLMKLQEIY